MPITKQKDYFHKILLRKRVKTIRIKNVIEEEVKQTNNLMFVLGGFVDRMFNLYT